jgi:hypothetical protein
VSEEKLPREERGKIQAWALLVFVPSTASAIWRNADLDGFGFGREIIGGAFWWALGALAVSIVVSALPAVKRSKKLRLTTRELTNALALFSGLSAIFLFV